MEASHALKLRKLSHATHSIVKCLVWLVNGQIGDRALNHVEVATKLALALS